MERNLKRISSELSIFLTFFLLIALGTLMLRLPFVSHETGLPFIDALFTATSAVCVTGLVTVPTSGFNPAGQFVLLVLMQLGAIGIMTLTSSLILFLRGDLDLQTRINASRLTDSYCLAEVEGILATIVKYTFSAELIGMVVLAAGFFLDGASWRESLYLGLFHAISAFCNAGFSPIDTSLIGVNGLIKTTVMLLIITGGLGYYVIFDLLEYIRRRDRLTIHSKTVLILTPLLIGAGALIFLLVEKTALPPLDAFFQSVTARTAGFNTININDMQPVSHVVLMTLMIIGAAPGSTGGGVKTTTFFVVIYTVYSAIRGHDKVVLFGRKLPLSNILRAFALLTLYLSFLAFSFSLLLFTEQTPFVATLFETASATGTVGLSLGLTPYFSIYGKLIITLCMFTGRIGPAVLMVILLRKKTASHVDYPEEKIILG